VDHAVEEPFSLVLRPLGVQSDTHVLDTAAQLFPFLLQVPQSPLSLIFFDNPRARWFLVHLNFFKPKWNVSFRNQMELVPTCLAFPFLVEI